MRRSGATVLAALLLCCYGVNAGVDHSTKLQQTLGSVNVAVREAKYDVALAKLDQMQSDIRSWRQVLAAAKEQAANPPAPAEEAKPPADPIAFSMNVTHLPEKCKRKSEEGAIMKVHYVGKLLATKKIFASSFHTGSQPFRFKLGSDEVIPAWNQGLVDMCEGERRRLMVPWDLGFGAEGGKGVPPYSELQYDFELVELSNPKLGKSKKKTEL